MPKIEADSFRIVDFGERQIRALQPVRQFPAILMMLAGRAWRKGRSWAPTSVGDLNKGATSSWRVHAVCGQALRLPRLAVRDGG